MKPPSERAIMAEIQLALTKRGIRIWRNNQGAFQDKRGVWVRFGLCIGSSDLIGVMPWAEGGRSPSGRFLAIEVKRPGEKPTKDQQAFIDMVNDMDGIAFVAHSVEEAIKCLKDSIL